MARKKWELALREARELRKKGSEILYERVVLLNQCFDDPDFRAWCDEQGTNGADYLDEELSDWAVDFMTLRAVLQSHPSREEWVKHNIRELIAMAIESAKHAKGDDAKPRQSWKARCSELEKECERLRAELASLQKTLEIVVSAKERAAAV